MFNKKLVGIPINMLAWVCLAISVGFAWWWYSLVAVISSSDAVQNYVIGKAEQILLAVAIMTTLALVGLSISMGGYTFTEKTLNLNRAALFSVEWILIAVSVALLWSIDNPDSVEDAAALTPSITATLALVLYTGYFLMEARGMKTGKKSKK
jgi:hypothetical protein